MLLSRVKEVGHDKYGPKTITSEAGISVTTVTAGSTTVLRILSWEEESFSQSTLDATDQEGSIYTGSLRDNLLASCSDR